jgi:ferredoxin-NADP reductase
MHSLTDRENAFDLLVERRTTAAEGVLSLTLVHPAGRELPEWEPGAHVDLLLGPDLVRQYSLCGDPADRRTWRLGVLVDREGRGGSRYVDAELVEGSTVQVRGPRNHFGLSASPRYLFVAGGIGITPILPMLTAAEAAGADWRLVYGGRTRASMAFLDELTSAYGEKVTTCPEDETGLLDLEALLAEPASDTLVYCCGPEPLLAAVEQRCASWPSGSLHVERFAPVEPVAPVRRDAFEVVLARTGRTLLVPPERSVLAAVEDAGVAVLSSCTEGTCGTCETDVLEGWPDHRDSLLTAEEREAADTMMICVSRSRGPRLVLDL